MKICWDCKKEKEIEQFSKNQTRCKECFSRYAKKRYLVKREHILKTNEKYRKTVRGQESMRAGVLRFRIKHPEQRAAHIAVMNALKLGKLEKEPCLECGEIKVEAHHYMGYEKRYWLIVRWYCKNHHEKQHHE